MSEKCNSHQFSWLVKSCIPNTSSAAAKTTTSTSTTSSLTISIKTTFDSLPDDLLLDCLSRVPPSSIHPISLVSRRCRRLASSPSFLRLRRLRNLLRPSLFALSADSLLTASLPFDQPPPPTQWRLSTTLTTALPSHARLCSAGPRIFILGRSAALKLDAWTGAAVPIPATLFPRKKFAVAEVAGRIYVAGGGGPATTAVEEYDPEEERWRVVSNAPRSRYGCVGAAADGVFYVIGGLRLGGGEAHVYAGSMDLYDVGARSWLRSRAVPGGGCVVAACAAAGMVYVLASHAVELSFWSFDGRRRRSSGGGGFGEWRRVKSPPLPAAVRVDGTVRFSCAGVGEKVVLVQVSGGRGGRGLREGLVLVYDAAAEEWSRAADLPEVIRRGACVGVEC